MLWARKNSAALVAGCATLRNQWATLLGTTTVIVAALIGFGSTLANTLRSESFPKVNAALTITAATAQRTSWVATLNAQGRIVLTQSDVLVIAAAAVVIRDGRSYVFKLQDGGSESRVVQQAVTVGRRQGNDVEILQGLAQGDRVAVQGAGFLDDGDVVRVTPTVRPLAMLSQTRA